ncbi:unnamed protein product, partial [Notodromas monacha]
METQSEQNRNVPDNETPAPNINPTPQPLPARPLQPPPQPPGTKDLDQKPTHASDRLGKAVAKRPFITISASLVLAFVGSTCFALFWTTETRIEKLWLPKNVEFLRDLEWVQDHYPLELRIQQVIIKPKKSGVNALQPEFFSMLLRVHETVSKLTVRGKTWTDVCMKIPVVHDEDSARNRKKRQILQSPGGQQSDSYNSYDNYFDFDNNTSKNTTLDDEDDFFAAYDDGEEEHLWDLPRELYCPVLVQLPELCWARGPLELFGQNASEFLSSPRHGNRLVTTDDIIAMLGRNRGMEASPVFGHRTDFSAYLGKSVTNASGYTMFAEALRMEWILKVNSSLIKERNRLYPTALGSIADDDTEEFESVFIEAMQKLSRETEDEDFTVLFSSSRSFVDVSTNAIMGDAMKLALGYGIVFIYTASVLGKKNWTENRGLLSIVGIFSVFLSIVTSMGLCQALGVLYGPMHNMLPFLLLGIGIDDMFVVVESFENIPKEKKDTLRVNELMGLTMRKAGLAITVTSLTDFAAFAIGASTSLPALSGFCIYAAVGVAFLYLFQVTFFAAAFALDAKRMAAGRNGFLPFIKHKQTFEITDSLHWTQVNVTKLVMKDYLGPALTHTWCKVLVLLLAGCMTGFGCWGLTELKQDFDPIWFLPQTSYVHQYSIVEREFFPASTNFGKTLISTKGHRIEALPKLRDLIQDMESTPEAKIVSVDSWIDSFENWTLTNFNSSFFDEQSNETDFMPKLNLFLYSPEGFKYQKNFVISGNFSCYGSAEDAVIELSTIDYVHAVVDEPEDQILALDAIRSKLRKLGTESNNEPIGRAVSVLYGSWETNQVIGQELRRNVALALGCVFVMTLLLIASLRASLIVTACVCLTVVDLAFLMHVWGLTIDTVSCVAVVIGIGLSVDYAAHVAHAFLQMSPASNRPSRNDRTRYALSSIGAAVFHGGLSTFLAIVVLADSDSHVFKTFFKVFVGIVGFGLFHGLILLPVVLSLVGPVCWSTPYFFAQPRHSGMYDFARVSSTSSPAVVFAVSMLNLVSTVDSSVEDGSLLSAWQMSSCQFGHCRNGPKQDALMVFSLSLTLLGWADKVFKRYFSLMTLKINFLAIHSHTLCCFPSQLSLKVNLLSICPTIICMNPSAFDVCISVLHIAPCLLSVSPHMLCLHYSYLTYHPCLWSIKEWSDIFPPKLVKYLRNEPAGYPGAARVICCLKEKSLDYDSSSEGNPTTNEVLGIRDPETKETLDRTLGSVGTQNQGIQKALINRVKHCLDPCRRGNYTNGTQAESRPGVLGLVTHANPFCTF